MIILRAMVLSQKVLQKHLMNESCKLWLNHRFCDSLIFTLFCPTHCFSWILLILLHESRSDKCLSPIHCKEDRSRSRGSIHQLPPLRRAKDEEQPHPQRENGWPFLAPAENQRSGKRSWMFQKSRKSQDGDGGNRTILIMAYQLCHNFFGRPWLHSAIPLIQQIVQLYPC